MKLFMDKLIMLVKCGDLYVCCQVVLKVCDEVVVKKLFEVFGECYKDCNGGYICVLKVGFCYGDNVLCVVIELVDCDEDVCGVVDCVCYEVEFEVMDE